MIISNKYPIECIEKFLQGQIKYHCRSIIIIALVRRMIPFRNSDFDYMAQARSNTTRPKQIELALLQKGVDPMSRLLQNQISKATIEYCIVKQKSRFERYLKRYGKWMDQYLNTIPFNSSALSAWNFIIFLFIFYHFLEIPIVMFITNGVSQSSLADQIHLVVNYLVICLLVLDLILVRPRAHVMVGGNIITSHTQIMRVYIWPQGIIDVFCLLILVVRTMTTNYLTYFEILFYIKYSLFDAINKQLSLKLLPYRLITAFYSFLKSICYIVFVTNVEACLYFAIDFYYLQQQGFNYQNGFVWLLGTPSLQLVNIYESFTWPAWYIYSLYWALQTARGVGYGINTPRNSMQVFYCNVCFLTTMVMFVLFTKDTINIIDKYIEPSQNRQMNLGSFVRMNQQDQLSFQCSSKIKQYISHSPPVDDIQFEAQIARQLSSRLLKQFHYSYKLFFFDSLPLFSLLSKVDEAQQCIKQLACTIETQHYRKDNFVYRQNEPNNRLCILEKGNIVVYSERLQLRRSTKEWEMFGQQSFFLNQKSLYNAKAEYFSVVVCIRRQNFISALRKHPPVFQKFNQLAQALVINQSSSKYFAISCLHCGQFHLRDHCQKQQNWHHSLNYRTASTARKLHQRVKTKRKTLEQTRLIGYQRHEEVFETARNTKAYYPSYNL